MMLRRLRAAGAGVLLLGIVAGLAPVPGAVSYAATIPEIHQRGPWAGYALYGTTFTSISASWVVPASRCLIASSISGFWVGIDGYGTGDVEQVGMSVFCQHGQPLYQAWFEMYPNYPRYYFAPIAPGDQMNAAVTGNSGGRFTLTVADATRGWVRSVTRFYTAASRATAEVIVEAPFGPTGPVPLTDFGSITFTSALANGQPIGSFASDRLTMVSGSSGNRIKAQTSSLTGGDSFTVTWHHTF